MNFYIINYGILEIKIISSSVSYCFHKPVSEYRDKMFIKN